MLWSPLLDKHMLPLPPQAHPAPRTMDFPCSSRPPITHVTQVGSPANSSLYSGVRSCLRSHPEWGRRE